MCTLYEMCEVVGCVLSSLKNSGSEEIGIVCVVIADLIESSFVRLFIQDICCRPNCVLRQTV